MPFWLSGLAVALLLGIAATLYFWIVRRRNDELAAGLHALSGLRWREFSRLVIAAMDRRGLTLVAHATDGTPDPRSNFTLAQGDRRWLLSCKHGSAYRIGLAPVDDLAASVRLGNAAGGILATEGHVEKEGREAAQIRNVEILDGPRLWLEVKPLIEDDLRAQIVGQSSARAKRHIAISWLGSATLGVLVAVALGNWSLSRSQAAAEAPARPPAKAAAVAVTPYHEPTEIELEEQRLAVSRALADTPGITRGVWQTRLTVAVDFTAPEAEVWPRICQQLERYPALRTVRVQLNPPPGSDGPVRWRQCKTM